jgi:hypothetical protein
MTYKASLAKLSILICLFVQAGCVREDTGENLAPAVVLGTSEKGRYARALAAETGISYSTAFEEIGTKYKENPEYYQRIEREHSRKQRNERLARHDREMARQRLGGEGGEGGGGGGAH